MDDNRELIAFLATLAAIVLLSKIGGTGADLAIMTGLVGVLGGLAARGRSSKKVEIDQPKDKPVPTTSEDEPQP
jgi:hypothetical protein